MGSKRTLWGKSRQLLIGLLITGGFMLGFALGNQYSTIFAQGNNFTLPEDAQSDFEPFYEAYNLIQQQFIDTPANEVLVNGAIRGMVEALDDQYSGYIDPEHYMFVDDNLSGAIEGIGVVISEVEGTGEIEVVNVLSDTPAEQAGIRDGDVFVVVNGEDVIGYTYLELAARVRGPAGTTVDITIRRGDRLIDYTIERARVQIPNVEYELLENDIAYIKMTQFTYVARDQVDDALEEMSSETLAGLILDLRGNPGGLLSAATQIGGLFLEEGVLLQEEFGTGETRIFQVRDNSVYEVFDNGDERLYTSNAANAALDIPIVVLVDNRSASASELVAGAWQDNGTATIIGTATFGKGTVQIQNALINGGGVRLTIARWLTPDGNSIAGSGIIPDIIVEQPDDDEEEEDLQLQAALEFLRLGATMAVSTE